MFDLHPHPTPAPNAYKLTAATDGDPPALFDALVQVCASPTCGCEAVHIRLQPQNTVAKALLSDADADNTLLTLDVSTRQVASSPQTQTLPTPQNIAPWLSGCLDDSDWLDLEQLMLGCKIAVIAAATVDDLVDHPFYFGAIEEIGELVPWTEVFPLSQPWHISAGRCAYEVDESYCVRPECGCRDVTVQFWPATNPTSDDPVNAAYTFICDHRKRTWTDAKTGRTPTGVAAKLLAQLRHATPRIEGLFARRADVLRAGYALARDTHAPLLAPRDGPSPTRVIKIGRNDPCPCGSGKKHKRCCG